jgi:hypothetical protein
MTAPEFVDLETELVFEDPRPAVTRPRGVTEEILPTLAALKEHPNRWARIKAWPGQNAAYGVRRKLREMKKDGTLDSRFEFEVRREFYDEQGKPSGGSVLYARLTTRSGT